MNKLIALMAGVYAFLGTERGPSRPIAPYSSRREYNHITKAKKRRQLANKSRKVNRKKTK